MKHHLAIAALGLITASLFLTGCDAAKIADERDALLKQNQEAQKELDHTRTALEAADTERSNLATENARLSSELDEAKAAAAKAAAAPAAPTPISETPKSGFSSIEGVETVSGPGTITARVPGDVLFEPGKIELKPGAKKTLEKIAAVVKKEYAGKTIRIEGYTDTDPIKHSNWDDNLELSLERAAAVQRFLEKQGVSPSLIYSAGFGEHRPRDSKAKSRRVEIVVITQ